MTTDGELLRQVTAYLDECEGTTILPESILDDIRSALPSTPQSRPNGLARFFDMSTPMKVGVAAAVVALAALLGLNLSGNLQIGPPPNSSDGPTPSGDAGAMSPLPSELQHPYLGPAKTIPGVETGALGDLDFTNGILQFDNFSGRVFTSTAGVTGDGQLRFETVVGDACAFGDVGLYSYESSPGGSVLTIAVGTDDCAARAAAVPGEYLRSDCRDTRNWCLGSVEAGTYASHYFEPRGEGEWQPRHGAMTFTVPEGWAAYGDSASTYGLALQAEYESSSIGPECYDCPGDRDTIAILSNPGAATEDCGEEGTVPGVGFGIQDLADWLVGHPGLIASEPETRTINGMDAITLVIEGSPDWTGTCDADNPFVAVPVFFRADPGYHWALSPGNHFQVTLVDIGDGNAVGVVVDAGDEADFDAFVEVARPIVESLEFPAP